MIYILGLAFGIDSFLFRLLPFPLLHSIPVFPIVAVLYLLLQYKKNDFDCLKDKKMIGLFVLGLSASLIRYFMFYKEEFLFMPIVRHTIAFLLGWLTYCFLKNVLRKYDLQKLGNSFLLTSIPFLLIGIIQRMQDQKVGMYYRITSLFSEPSYYGDYLVLVLAPFIFLKLLKIKTESLKNQTITLLAAFLWVINLVAVQSGTALIKLSLFLFCLILFYPQMKKVRLVIFTLGLGAVAYIILSPETFMVTLLKYFGSESGTSYVRGIIHYIGHDLYANPDNFFKHQTFYDRFYPLYAALKNLFTPAGFIGLGFGGDYYEFKNLFPAITHEEMIKIKTSLSFFNSFASKFILFFGISGLAWIILQFKNCLQTKNIFIKVGLFNVLLATLWGVSNFSLPYIWFWLALAEISKEQKT